MKAIVTATLYIPRMNKLFKVGETVDVDQSMIYEYRGFFDPVVEKAAPAPLNKMVTAEKEMTKAFPEIKPSKMTSQTKRGRK